MLCKHKSFFHLVVRTSQFRTKCSATIKVFDMFYNTSAGLQIKNSTRYFVIR